MTTAARYDGWANVITGLGVASRDKRLASEISVPTRLTHQELTDLYAGDAIAARICDLPAAEMTRQWIDFANDGDADLGKAVMQELEVLGAQEALCEGLTWGRLYGGAICLIGADDGQTDLRQPLNLERIRSLAYLTVIDRPSLEIAQRSTSLRDFNQPSIYRIVTSNLVGADGMGLGQEIHASRVLRFDGARTPRWRIERNDGWNDSIFIKLLGAVRDFWGAYDGTATLMADFSQAVYQVEGLADLIGSNQDEVVIKRLRAVDTLRSILRAVVIDKNETFERKATPTTGLPDLLDRLQQLLSAVTGIPVTLLMGRSPAGQNATGESDIRLFYDSVKSTQATTLRPKIEYLLRILLRAKKGPTGGKEPKNWSFDFRPLWQLTEGELVELRRKQAETDSIYIDRQVLHPEEVRQSRFGGDRYSAETVLDPAFDDLADQAAANAEDPEDEDIEDDDGAEGGQPAGEE